MFPTPPSQALPTGQALLDAIDALRRERNAVILAHYYQEPEIQDIADHIGDSMQLAKAARDTNADVIVFCGVHFMAETAKILNPDRVVVLPDLDAGCSLADSCPADELAEFKAEHPEHLVVSYINCTAETKALSDIICTSSNAVRVIESLPADRPILFAPDRNLGAYLQRQTGRPMDLWQGSCIVHETFSERRLVELLAEHPDAKVIAHPEWRMGHYDGADFRMLNLLQHSALVEVRVGHHISDLAHGCTRHTGCAQRREQVLFTEPLHRFGDDRIDVVHAFHAADP
jgi:quinolinate synthase